MKARHTLFESFFIPSASADVVITSDEGVRGGKVIPLKATVDAAVEGVGGVRRVFVAKRTGAEVKMNTGRDVWLEEVCECVHACMNVCLCVCMCVRVCIYRLS